VLGASFDSVAKNRAFAEKYGYPYKLLCDTDRAIGTMYGAIDSDDPEYPRRISYLIGPDKRIAKAYASVNAATHPASVLADIADIASR
jgi:thioredoxin-dependent peroxiredoxin